MPRLSLRTRFARAKKKLEAMGVKFAHPSWGGMEEQGGFCISGEDQHGDWSDLDNHPEKALVVDYWQEFGEGSITTFGVDNKIIKVLQHYGLHPEWINAGVLGVYDG